MNFSPKVKSWLLLITLVFSSGGAVTLTAIMGGSKLGLAILAGLITGTTNVYHALANSPNDPPPAVPPVAKVLGLLFIFTMLALLSGGCANIHLIPAGTDW